MRGAPSGEIRPYSLLFASTRCSFAWYRFSCPFSTSSSPSKDVSQVWSVADRACLSSCKGRWVDLEYFSIFSQPKWWLTLTAFHLFECRRSPWPLLYGSGLQTGSAMLCWTSSVLLTSITMLKFAPIRRSINDGAALVVSTTSLFMQVY